MEIDGLTGELIRKIALPAGTTSLELSLDGSKMAAAGYIIDVESGEVIKAHPAAYKIKFLHPDNSKIIYAPFNQAEYNFFVWDIETGESESFDIGKKLITALEVSNNGKFFAIATLETGYDDEQHTHFYLFDAQTMQFIKELEDVPSDGRTINVIQFSENAKYVGYGKSSGNQKATFFTCEAPYQKWEFENKEYPLDKWSYFGFINEEYVFLVCYKGNYFYGVIRRIEDNTDIFKTNLYYSKIPRFNKIYNSIITDKFYLSDEGALISSLNSLDFEKILSTVGVKEEEDANAFRAEYSGGILTINGLESQSVEINLTINNIQGELVFSQNIAAVHGSQISLPVSLPSGVYIARIRTGENNYSSKFIVVN